MVLYIGQIVVYDVAVIEISVENINSISKAAWYKYLLI